MKKVLLLLLVFMVSYLCSDSIWITVSPEGVETVTENTELILSDPFVGEIITETTEMELVGIEAGMDMTISGPTKSISLPLSYTFKKIKLGMTIPYILKREMEYLNSTEEASGLGDISFKVGAKREIKGTDFGIKLKVKLPTGDSDHMEGEHLVPLGTGSTDFYLSLSSRKKLPNFAFSGNVAYKFNGMNEKTAELLYDDMDNDPATEDIETIKYDIYNGNMFVCKGNFDYFLNKWTLGGLFVFSTTAEGSKDIVRTNNWGGPTIKEDGISNRQDMILMDLIPMVSYRVLKTDITLLAVIPLYTKRNKANDEDSRDLVVSFKVGREF